MAEENSPPPKSPSGPFRQYKLVSVSLKEAALDSPSFRASVNHLDSQVANTEKWLVALAASVTKIPKQVKQLHLFFHSFLEYFVPPFLQEGLLDQEYTVELLNTTKEGLQNLWLMALNVLQVNISAIDINKDDLLKRMARYRVVRRRFDACQEKYDNFLLIHMATPKLKEAGLVMEDSQQLAAVRREYIHLSLELVQEFADVGQFINLTLNRLNYLLWRDRNDKIGSNPHVAALFKDYWTAAKRIEAWSEGYKAASENMREDLAVARRNVEERTIAHFTPSKNINDYRPQLINSRVLADCDDESVEKYGYLFMKTWQDKQSKPFWVQRWAFVQGGVFGMLELLPSQTSVQETDKFGVLLCNVKYAPNEERRLCFELKTIDTTVVFQAETLEELKLWLKVFENAKNRIVAQDDEMHDLIQIASGRYPPVVTELQSQVNTAMDRELTSAKIVSSSGQIITSSKLSTHLEKNEKFFQRHIYHQIGRINLPFMTDATRSSLIAYSLAGSTAVTTALSANIWGSINWGRYYLYDSSLEDGAGDLVLPDDDNMKQIGLGIKLPKNFPNSWTAKDIQLRALFESAMDAGECCLLSYSCLISPNLRQELRSTQFITAKHVYSYVHSFGFVSLSKSPITHFAEATNTPQQNFDLIKITMMRGLFKMKLFLDDGDLIAAKLNCIYQNASSDNPQSVTTLISKLIEIEQNHLAKKNEKNRICNGTEHSTDAQGLFDLISTKDTPPSVPPSIDSLTFRDNMPLKGEHDFKMLPRTLLHILFGSRSNILDDSYPVIDVRYTQNAEWHKSEDPDVVLERVLLSEIIYVAGKSGKFTMKQEIEKAIPDQYYSVKINRSNFKVRYGPEFSISGRFVITAREGGLSRLKYYYDIDVAKRSLMSIPIHYLCNTFSSSFFRLLCRNLDEASKQIGHNGKLLKAIYFYGKISVTDAPMARHKHLPPSQLDICDVLRLLIKGTMTSVVRRILAFSYFILSCLDFVRRQLSVYKFLVGVIVMLTILNVLLGARSTQHYWNARHAKSMVRDVLDFEPMKMQRAIYLKDVQELLLKQAPKSNTSACFKTFQNQSIVLNHDQGIAWNRAYDDDLSYEVALKLSNSLREIALKRNELLVSLNMLNLMEEEIAMAEWNNWLISELARCEQVKRLSILEGGKLEGEVAAGIGGLESYCESCSEEMSALMAKQA